MAVAILSPRVPRAQARRVGRRALRRRQLDTVGFLWREALDSAAAALDAATAVLPPAEIGARRRQLTLEREEARSLLRRLARMRGVAAPAWPLHRTR
jgi:multidrug resistance efflux pump